MSTAIPLSVSWALKIANPEYKLPLGLYQKRTYSVTDQGPVGHSSLIGATYPQVNVRLWSSR